ncbi:MAG: peptidoglycan DD-metalloendopeptidase family protein [bacterium]
MTKISLFIKTFNSKACFSLAIVILLAGLPSHASAGFFSDLMTKVLGSNAQATSIDGGDTATNNSQTIPLLEPSINPDTNNSTSTKSDTSVIVDASGALVPVTSSLGPATDLEQYASDAKISTYTVKKGDTVRSIAKKFKTTESAITYSNSDLKKSDLLKIGQKLVILPLKPQADKALAKQVQATPDVKVDTSSSTVAPDKVAEPDTEGPMFTINIDTPLNNPSKTAPLTPETQTGTNIQTEPTTPAGQNGDISGGYIWPFDKGVGRVSQGLHADQAYDFAAPTGTPIHAISGGTVLIAHPTGYNGGYGKYVVINFDDGRQAIFGHMSKVAVEEGDVVSQGEIIGYVGSTGHSTGPHVHIGFHGSLGNPYIGLKLNSTDFQTND